MTENTDNNTIAILQYNLCKNSSRTHSVLNDPNSSKYAILILQEQYWSEYTEPAPTHGSWTLFESGAHPNRNPRSAIYVNNHVFNRANRTMQKININRVGDGEREWRTITETEDYNVNGGRRMDKGDGDDDDKR